MSKIIIIDMIKEACRLQGGVSDGMTLSNIAKKHEVDIEVLRSQLNKGIKVEREHTDDKSIAKKIAMDHLFEDPAYYDKLKTIGEK